MTIYVYDRDTGKVMPRDEARPRRDRVDGPYIIPDVREHESPMGDGTIVSSRSHQREICARHNLRLKDPSESRVGPVRKEAIARKYGARWIGD